MHLGEENSTVVPVPRLNVCTAVTTQKETKFTPFWCKTLSFSAVRPPIGFKLGEEVRADGAGVSAKFCGNRCGGG